MLVLFCHSFAGFHSVIVVDSILYIYYSTCGQAIEIAGKMNAKNVLLTHFSQRYAKLPIMKDETAVAIAFDHMEVCMCLFIHADLYNIRVLFLLYLFKRTSV